MPDYRRVFIPGACYFFTLVTHHRKPLFSNADNRLLLRQAMKDVMRKHPFTINALVLLPDHLHCVITLPKDDMNYSKRWSMIKRKFSQVMVVETQKIYQDSRIKRRELSLWQRRFWEHAIRNEQDYINHIQYCYWNPVKHDYVQRVADWPYSTFHRDVKTGLFPLDWGGDDVTVFESMLCGE